MKPTTITISNAGVRFFAPAMCFIFALCLLSFGSQKMLAQTSTFNLSTGIGTGQVSDYSWNGTVLTVNDGANIEITGTVTDGKKRIEVATDAIASITLNGVSITGMPNGVGTYSNACPLWLNGGSTLSLTLVGDNTLTAGVNAPAIRCEDAELIITAASTGSLTANGGYDAAGIGGRFLQGAGTITINGGTITAYAGNNSGAGIGGGGSSSGYAIVFGGGTISINGGTVTAYGGRTGIGGSDALLNWSPVCTLAMNGDGVVFASNIMADNQTGVVKGLLFEGAVGKVYGSLTLSEDLTIPAGSTLNIPGVATLTIPNGVTLTNNGAIIPANGSAVTIIGTLTGNPINGANVTTPTAAGATDFSVTLNAATLLAATGQSVEYAYGDDNTGPTSAWQDSPNFSGLTTGETLYFYARSKEISGLFNAGTITAGVPILVELEPPFITSVTPSGTGLALSGDVVVTFSEEMDPATTGTVQLNSLPALSGGAWSVGNTVFTIPFSALDYETLYTINVSGFKGISGKTIIANNSNTFTTEDAPPPLTYTGAVSPSGTHTFPGKAPGYDNTTMAQTFTFTNTGTGPVTVTTSLTGGAHFEITSPLNAQTVASGADATFNVRPKSGLTVAGTPYTDQLTISWVENAGATITVNLSFAVNTLTGDGTSSSPYLITSVADLEWLASAVNTGTELSGIYRLEQNLDLLSAPFSPIGIDNAHPFTHTFDGNGKTISNVNVNIPGVNNIFVGGLFGFVSGGTIKNLGLIDPSVSIGRGASAPNLNHGAGGVAGFLNNSSRVENCYVVGGHVTGDDDQPTGGIAGSIRDNAAIINCYATCSVKTGNGGRAGGIAGMAWYGATIQNCVALNEFIVGVRGMRIANDFGYPDNPFLANNAAWAEMPVNGAIITDPGDKGESTAHGADLTIEEIYADGTLGARFANNGNPWTTANGKLPGFGTPTDIPAHLPWLGISGPEMMRLGLGYAATTSEPFTLIGYGTISVTLQDNPSGVSWDSGSSVLTIAAGIPSGKYPIKLTASNTTGSQTIIFTLVIGLPSTFDLSTGTGDGEGVDWTLTGATVAVHNYAEVTVTGSTASSVTKYHIDIDENASAQLILNNATITGLATGESPVYVKNGAALTITLQGVSSLKAGVDNAGIWVHPNGTLIIEGPGSLTADGDSRGAGIGGANTYSNGTVIINGGVILAQSNLTNTGSGAAGIGGGVDGGGGTITITGGIVTAQGSTSGAGIGGGTYGAGAAVTITGGKVTALSQNSGTGIGRGAIGSGQGSLIINGDAVVFARSVGDQSPKTRGILFDNARGAFFYGTNVTPEYDFAIPTGMSLTVPSGATLTINSGLKVEIEDAGALYIEGTLTNNGTVTPLDNSTASVTGTRTGNLIDGANVNAPAINSITLTSVTLDATTLKATTGQSIEYAYGTSSSTPSSSWQDGLTFTGLTNGNTYYIFARSKEDTHFKAGATSSGTEVTLTMYGATFSVNNVTENGITATGTLSPENAIQGTTVTATITLTGTATFAGTHTVGLSSATLGTGLTPPVTVTRNVTLGESVTSGNTFDYTFIMPSGTFSDLIVTHSFTADVSYTATQTGGASGTANSTGIVFTFNVPITGLTDANIEVTDDTGSVLTGTLTEASATGTNTVWTLALVTVLTEGDVTVDLKNLSAAYHCIDAPKSVAVYKNVAANHINLYDTNPISGAGWTYDSGEGSYTIEDGANVTVSGTTTSRYLFIETASATVTLQSVNMAPAEYPAILLGANSSLTLILTGENTVKGGVWSTEAYAGIQVHTLATLTIEGTGSLSATGGSNSNGAEGAGIGGQSQMTAGDIVVKGGFITASGNTPAFDIGTGTVMKEGDGKFILNGNAIVYAVHGKTPFNSLNPYDPTLLKGILYKITTGTVYGSVEIPLDWTVPAGYTLSVDGNRTLSIPAGVTLSNYGTVIPVDNSTVTVLGSVLGTGNKINGANIMIPPSADVITENSITLKAGSLWAATGQSVEYAYSTDGSVPVSGWQDGLTFNGLTLNTLYYFFARSKENVNFYAGAAKGGGTITTSAEKNMPLPIQAGWNWISVNVESNSPSILEQITTSIGANGVQIKGINDFLLSNGGVWIGSLKTISPTSMYQVELQSDQNVTVTGTPVNPATTPIAINYGWNWLGYTPQYPLTVHSALAGINVQLGDQIKGQNTFAIWTGSSWIGSLLEMESGKGYMLYTDITTPQTLIYPPVVPLSATLRNKDVSDSPVTPKWQSNANRYPNNMTLTVVAVAGDSEIRNNQLEIAALCENEVRGSALLQYVPELDRYYGFLLVSGEKDETITFKTFDHATGKEQDASNTPLTFAANAIHGDPFNPYPVTLSADITGKDQIVSQISVYPNPASARLYISRPAETIDRIEIMDLNGRLILLQKDFNDASIDVSSLETGMYLLRLTVNNQTVVKMFIKGR